MSRITFLVLLSLTASTAFGQWVSRQTGSAENFHGIAARGLQGATVVGESATILYTEDDGFDWGPQTGVADVDYHAISFADHDVGLIAGTAGTILFTTDAGTTWQTIETGFMHPYWAASQTSPQLGAVAGVNSIFQPIVGLSSDRWQTHAFHVFYPFHNGSNQEGTIYGIEFVTAEIGCAAVSIFDGQGAICRTTDGGTTWATVHWSTSAFYAIDFPVSDASQTGYAVGMGGLFAHTTDGGQTWSDSPTVNNEDLYGVSFPTLDEGWAVGANGTIIHTTNGGQNWTLQTSPSGSGLTAVSMLNADTGYICGDAGTVLYTANGGGESGNQPPGAFARIAPEDSSLNGPFPPVHFAWTLSLDPDGDTVTYILHLWSADSPAPYDTTIAMGDTSANVGLPPPGPPPSGYTVHWTVYATDSHDTVSASNGAGLFYIYLEGAADDPASALPREFALSAYPNPFNPTTTLSVSLPVASGVVLKIFDITGRLVQEMPLGHLTAGRHSISFDGSARPSGLYLAVMQTANQRVTQKLVLMK